jgi:hypothetical protein
VSVSLIYPNSITIILSATLIVLSRWAITIVVAPYIPSDQLDDRLGLHLDFLSRALVASPQDLRVLDIGACYSQPLLPREPALPTFASRRVFSASWLKRHAFADFSA